MKANSSNYGSTVPEVTADLLADEPASVQLGHFQGCCEDCGKFLFEHDERKLARVCAGCEDDREKDESARQDWRAWRFNR